MRKIMDTRQAASHMPNKLTKHSRERSQKKKKKKIEMDKHHGLLKGGAFWDAMDAGFKPALP